MAIFWSTDWSTWNRTLAEFIEQIEFGDSGHSRVATDDWDKIATERPHPNVANSRSRPKAGTE